MAIMLCAQETTVTRACASKEGAYTAIKLSADSYITTKLN